MGKKKNKTTIARSANGGSVKRRKSRKKPVKNVKKRMTKRKRLMKDLKGLKTGQDILFCILSGLMLFALLFFGGQIINFFIGGGDWGSFTTGYWFWGVVFFFAFAELLYFIFLCGDAGDGVEHNFWYFFWHKVGALWCALVFWVIGSLLSAGIWCCCRGLSVLARNSGIDWFLIFCIIMACLGVGFIVFMYFMANYEWGYNTLSKYNGSNKRKSDWFGGEVDKGGKKK